MLKIPSALLTEWFVEEMDGQLREQGVGDVVVGKHVGRLMATLGGRIGALRGGDRRAPDGTAIAAGPAMSRFQVCSTMA